MNPLTIFKVVTEFAVSVGVSSIVGNVIKMTADPNAKVPKRIAMGVGGFVLSSMVSDYASRYAVDRIDASVEFFNTILKPAASKLIDKAEEGLELTEEKAETMLKQAKFDLIPLQVASEESAREIMGQMQAQIIEKGHATVRDLFDLLLAPADKYDEYMDEYGWFSLEDASISQVDEYWTFQMPNFVLIDTTNNKEN